MSASTEQGSEIWSNSWNQLGLIATVSSNQKKRFLADFPHLTDFF